MFSECVPCQTGDEANDITGNDLQAGVVLEGIPDINMSLAVTHRE